MKICIIYVLETFELIIYGDDLYIWDYELSAILNLRVIWFINGLEVGALQLTKGEGKNKNNKKKKTAGGNGL